MGTGRWDDDSRWEQGRSPRSRRPDDDARQGRAGSRGGGSSAWDRPPRSGSRYPRRDVESNWDDGGRGGSSGSRGRPGGSSRGSWDDPRDPRGGRGGPPDRTVDRSMRGGRPPVRDDWDAPARGRGAPGYAGSSRRPPQGGGLWGDQDPGPRGRPGMRGPAGARDPRAPRGGRGAEPEPEAGQLSFAKGFGIVASMFALGVLVAFAFFMLSRPNPQVNETPAVPTSTTAPEVTPSTAPNVTPSPSGLVPGDSPAFVFIIAGGSAGQ